MHWINKGQILSSLPAPPSFLLLLFKLAKNLGYALWNLVLAAWYGSFWYLTAGVYHLLLGGIRVSAVSAERRQGDSGRTVMKTAGVLLLCLSLAVSGTVVLSVEERIADVRSLIPLLGSATFTFYKMTMAIVKIVRRKEERAPAEITLRWVALAEASMAMLTLERTMVASFDDRGTDSAFFLTTTAALGMAVFLVTVGAGVYLLVRAEKMKQNGVFSAE